MTYTPKTWACGDTITAEDLNHIEQGIANSGGGTPLIVNEDIESETLDHTWQEIWNAFPNVAFYRESTNLGTSKGSFIAIGYKNDPTTYYVTLDGGDHYEVDNPNGYPQVIYDK